MVAVNKKKLKEQISGKAQPKKELKTETEEAPKVVSGQVRFRTSPDLEKYSKLMASFQYCSWKRKS